MNILRLAYPHFFWDPMKWTGKTKIAKSQELLARRVSSLFPNTSVLLNYKHPNMEFSFSGKPMELDVFLPQYSLAFEYQVK
jgi:hypothetical protein